VTTACLFTIGARYVVPIYLIKGIGNGALKLETLIFCLTVIKLSICCLSNGIWTRENLKAYLGVLFSWKIANIWDEIRKRRIKSK
jgi:hypothetical protein